MKNPITNFMNDEDTDTIWLIICIDILILMGMAANYGWIY